MGATRRRVLVTGATGTIGQLLSERLAGDYELVLHGRTPRTPEQERSLRRADLEDEEEVGALMAGVDTVLHLAGAASPDSSWEDVLSANIVGCRNVMQAAVDAGVRRIVYASSNHAMGMYDRHGEWPVSSTDLPRADSLYGVSKVFGEVLGRFLHDEHGIDVINLRIGWTSGDPFLTDLELLRAMWLSEDDTEQVFRRAIEAPVAYGTYYAVSDNPDRRWDITPTMVELGYRPRDSWTERAGGAHHTEDDVVDGGAPSPDDWPKGS